MAREFERVLTIDCGVVDSALTDFPVLVHLSSSSGKNSADLTHIFSEIASEYGKLYIYEADGTSCPIEVERWDVPNAEAWLWVKVSSVSASDGAILRLKYSRNYVANPALGAVNTAAGAAVWDSNYVLVDHMQDYGDTSRTVDSTSNSNDGTKKGAGEPIETTSGKIGNAQTFDGNDDYIDCGKDSTFDMGIGDFTLEAWVKTSYFAAHQLVLMKGSAGAGAKRYELAVLSTKKAYVELDDDTGQDMWSSATDISDGAWKRLALTVDRDATAQIYVNASPDGAAEAVDAVLTLDDAAKDFCIGVSSHDEISLNFNGSIDEVRASKGITRSAAWEKASYYSEADQLITYGDLLSFTEAAGMGVVRRSPALIRRERVAEALVAYLEFKVKQRALYSNSEGES